MTTLPQFKLMYPIRRACTWKATQGHLNVITLKKHFSCSNKTYLKPLWGSSGKKKWRNWLPHTGWEKHLEEKSAGINWGCLSFQPAKFGWSLHICRTVCIHAFCSRLGLTFRFFSYISYRYVRARNSFTGYVTVLNLLSLTIPRNTKNKGQWSRRVKRDLCMFTLEINIHICIWY